MLVGHAASGADVSETRELIALAPSDWNSAIEIASFSGQRSSAGTLIVANSTPQTIYVLNALGTTVAAIKPGRAKQISVSICAAAGALGLSETQDSPASYVPCEPGYFHSVRIRANQPATELPL
jgi:hypothetical protein